MSSELVHWLFRDFGRDIGVKHSSLFIVDINLQINSKPVPRLNYLQLWTVKPNPMSHAQDKLHFVVRKKAACIILPVTVSLRVACWVAGSLEEDGKCVVVDGCGSLVFPEEVDVLVIGLGAAVLDFRRNQLSSIIIRDCNWLVTLTWLAIPVVTLVLVDSTSRISRSQSRSRSSGLRAPSFANRSAHSLPSIPTWPLTCLNLTFGPALSRAYSNAAKYLMSAAFLTGSPLAVRNPFTLHFGNQDSKPAQDQRRSSH
ncbi:hypothetical protein K503DRAFT_407020 [Rhizopogon vinicolor AM-OR11-026]|uniref:Uncharacterized protein n=1 Tax=Rhizopogon vinicolor AM-OR11-026 TaxID=1314800 RepID=A0A1B7NB36_9AGAM|nr:hypothetical protein K503DRAFT_407020 [Rhizopogon vinicolor AM-OR11-026]